MARKYEIDDEEGMDPLIAPADFDGPTSNRKCTDVFCLLLLFATWGGMTFLGIYGYNNGDYRRIIYPLDFDGNICGTDYGDVDMTEYPFLQYVNKFGGGVCVNACPKVETPGVDLFSVISYGGVHQVQGSVWPADDVVVGNYSGSEDVRYCMEDGVDKCYPGGSQNFIASLEGEGVNEFKGYAIYALDSEEYLWRCVPSAEALRTLRNATSALAGNVVEVEDNGILDELFQTGSEFWTKLFADLLAAWRYILGFGMGVSVLIGFLYCVLLRIPCVLSIMVWGSILSVIALSLGAGWYAGENATIWAAQEPPKYSDRQISIAKYGSYVLYVIGVVLLLITCFLRKAIQIAMGSVKETSKAVTAMPALIFFPILQSTGLLIFMILFIIYGALVASMGDIVVKNGEFHDMEITYRSFEMNDFVKKSGWFLLFCFFWTTQFIAALGSIIISMSFAKWYFTRDRSSIGSLTLVKSICGTLYYHQGTAAFGSLLVAIVQLMRAFLAYVQKKAKQMDNKCAEALLCCCQCCLWCFEKCLRFLNKNAYIQTAIFGTPFCESAREAFFLILRNAGRIGAIAYVTSAIGIVGRLFIMSATTAAAYFALNETEIVNQLNSVTGPTCVIAIMSYYVGDMFLDVFDMGVSTIIQCFIADEEMFSGDQVYAGGGLRNWIDTSGN